MSTIQENLIKLNATKLELAAGLRKAGVNVPGDVSLYNLPSYFSQLPDAKILQNTIVDLLVGGMYSITIPSNVLSIHAYCFYKNTQLNNIKFDGSSKRKFGDYCLAYCTGLKDISSWSSYINNVGLNCFYECTALTKVIFGNSVTIGNNAFSGCTGLTYFEIGDTPTLGKSILANCKNLTTFICRATTPPTITSSTFSNAPATMNIYVPAESVSAYQSAANWTARASYIQAIPE